MKGLLVLGIATLMPMAAWAQQPAQPGGPPAAVDAATVAKKLNNPISDLVSVPFQFNWAQGVGPDKLTRLILNVQPVMPFTLNKNWNMISRVIMPLVGQPPLVEGGEPASGLSDILTSFFFSPSGSQKLTWGVGPAFSLPSTSEPTLGTGKWSMGPTAVVLRQTGPWTFAVLWNHIWSFAGAESREDVNQDFIQPVVAYTTKKNVTFSVNAEAVGNLEADTDQWTVPINFQIAKLSTFGMFPASYQLGVGIFVAGPENGPEWQLRAAVTIVLPRRQGP